MTDAPRILIHTSNPAPMLDRLAEVAPEIEPRGHDSYEGLDPVLAEFRPDIAYAVAFHGREDYPREALLGMNGPRWIAVGGAGVDHLTPWDSGAVTVSNAAEVAAAMIAEYVFGAVLHFTLDIDGMAGDRAARHWERTLLMTPLNGK